MNKLKKIFKKILKIKNFIEIKQAFIITAFFLIALGNMEQFFILFFCVTLHELTHVIVAYLFGLRASRVIFTALGETAVIKNLDTLELHKKIIILLSGPVANVILALFFRAVTHEQSFFSLVNFSLAFFNLLPVYPLDGGRIIRYAMSEVIGVIKSHKLMSKLSAVVCRIIIILGVIQVILYPYNISLICIGLYLIKLNRRQYLPDVLEFYNSKLNKIQGVQKIRNVKNIIVMFELPASALIERLCWNSFCRFEVLEQQVIAYEINELQLMEYVSVYGISHRIGDICRAMQINEFPVYCVHK